MFCRNCGREIEADVKFCPSCGTSTSTGAKNISVDIPIKNLSEINRAVILHYLSIICSVIIVLLAFSKVVAISSLAFSKNISVWGLIKSATNLMKYEIESVVFLVVGSVAISAAVNIGFAINHIVKAFNAGPNLDSNSHIVYDGYTAMNTIAISGAVAVIVILIFGTVGEYDSLKVSFNEKFYIIIALACLNRFAFMPKLNQHYWEKKKHSEVEEKVGNFDARS